MLACVYISTYSLKQTTGVQGTGFTRHNTEETISVGTLTKFHENVRQFWNFAKRTNQHFCHVFAKTSLTFLKNYHFRPNTEVYSNFESAVLATLTFCSFFLADNREEVPDGIVRTLLPGLRDTHTVARSLEAFPSSWRRQKIRQIRNKFARFFKLVYFWRNWENWKNVELAQKDLDDYKIKSTGTVVVLLTFLRLFFLSHFIKNMQS